VYQFEIGKIFRDVSASKGLKTHLKGKKLDLAQLGKAIVDSATKPLTRKKKKAAKRHRR